LQRYNPDSGPAKQVIQFSYQTFKHTHTKQGHEQIYTNKSEKGREQRSWNFKHVASPSARNQTKLNASVFLCFFFKAGKGNGNAESDRTVTAEETGS